MSYPLVSIITVVYNGEKYLEQTIESVKNQSYQNIEYIIIDGGSTDSTLEIIEHNKNFIDYWISEPDNGLYDAMNKGIKVAKGALIGMINSDDWYELNAVELMVNAYQKNPDKSIFHGNIYNILSNGKREYFKHNTSIFKFKYMGMTYNHPSMFMVKEEYAKHLYNVNLPTISDFQFIMEAFIRNSEIFYYVDKPISNYRLGGASAGLTLKEHLKHGYIARKNAGMNFIENSFSVFIRFSAKMFWKVRGVFISRVY